MRTTLNIDDNVLEAARELAHVRRISVGRALSILARRGLTISFGIRRDPVSGLTVFDVPEDFPQVTVEMTARANEMEDLRTASAILDHKV